MPIIPMGPRPAMELGPSNITTTYPGNRIDTVVNVPGAPVPMGGLDALLLDALQNGGGARQAQMPPLRGYERPAGGTMGPRVAGEVTPATRPRLVGAGNLQSLNQSGGMLDMPGWQQKALGYAPQNAVVGAPGVSGASLGRSDLAIHNPGRLGQPAMNEFGQPLGAQGQMGALQGSYANPFEQKRFETALDRSNREIDARFSEQNPFAPAPGVNKNYMSK